MVIDKEFNMKQLCRIEKLLSIKKEKYRVDLHIHTNYSADGLQTVEQAFRKAKEKQFDIISIADHDSIDAYNEIICSDIYKYDGMPIIVPGIEFTVSYPEYEGRCHVLTYFFNANNTKFMNNLYQNKKAYKNRVRIWFERIDQNRYLQHYFKLFNIECTEENYWEFLKLNTITIPEYPTISQYIYSLLRKNGIFIWDIYEKAVIDNEMDPCDIRRKKKKIMLKKFYDRYNGKKINDNFRKLRPIIAPVGVDDLDYPMYKPSGSLSVNEYGQLSIQELINSGVNVMAHPNMTKLHCVDHLETVISGLELNYRSDDQTNTAVFKKAQEKSIMITKGSDKHSDTNEYYEDLGFYDMTYHELEVFYLATRKNIEKYKN